MRTDPSTPPRALGERAHLSGRSFGASICNAGVKLNGHPYPKILWEPGAEKLDLTDDWGDPRSRVDVIPSFSGAKRTKQRR